MKRTQDADKEEWDLVDAKAPGYVGRGLTTAKHGTETSECYYERVVLPQDRSTDPLVARLFSPQDPRGGVWFFNDKVQIKTPEH